MEKLLCQAIHKFGAKNQSLQTIEECSELIQALIHFDRGKVTLKDVCNEIADVIIMTQQMRLLFGDDLVDQCVKEKLERLKALVNTNGANNEG